jgi:tetratricopeptide (TPR) repeat protein
MGVAGYEKQGGAQAQHLSRGPVHQRMSGQGSHGFQGGPFAGRSVDIPHGGQIVERGQDALPFTGEGFAQARGVFGLVDVEYFRGLFRDLGGEIFHGGLLAPFFSAVRSEVLDAGGLFFLARLLLPTGKRREAMPVNMYFHLPGAMTRPIRFLPALLAVLLVLAHFPDAAFAADPALASVRTSLAADRAPEAKPSAETDKGGHGFRVDLKKSAPSEGILRVGGAASFVARLFQGDKELPTDGYLCRWRADAGAKFLEDEGPFTNTAIFLRPGRQRIWVEVVPRSGPSQGLAAVADPVELDVSQPAFALAASPAAPLVGEEVTVSIRDFPVHDGVEFRWDPLPPQARLVRVGERSLTFYPTQAAATAVRVTAVAKDGGKAGGDLGSARITVTAKPYGVTVDNRGLSGMPAVVWREGEGPVPAEGVAVGQNVRLRAGVLPTPGNPPLAFAWSLCPGARARGGEDTREIEVSRQEVGQCEATVEVRDGRGLLLGRGQGGFTVAVSQQELDDAVAKARETDRLTALAGEAWTAGDVDRAMEAAGKAVRLSPKNGPALAALDRLSREKAKFDGYLLRADQALASDEFEEVAAMLAEAAKVNAKAGAIEVMRRRAQTRQEVLGRVGSLLAQARDKWEGGEVEAALSLAGQALALDPGHVAAKTERERMVSGRDRLIAALKQSAGYLMGKRFDSAAEALGEARAINPRFAAVREMEQAIAARKERAWRMDERLARARDQWNAGDVDGALGVLAEAQALDPENAGAAAARKKMAEVRDNLARAEDRAEAAIGRGKLDEARAAMAEAEKINARHPRLAELQKAAAHRVGREQRLAALKAEAARRNAAGDVDGALLALNDILALVPGDAAVTAERDRLARSRDAMAEALARARDFLAGRRYDLALAALAEAEKINAKLPALAGWREKALSEKGRAEAEAAARLAEAGAKLDKKEYAAARDALDAARKTAPLPAQLAAKAKELERRIEEGRLRQDAARREQAVRDKTAATATDADRRGRCEALGREAGAKRAGGDHAGAIRSYQSLLTLCPDTCQAYNNVGASLFSLGYAAESLPWFDEAIKCAPAEKLYKENAELTRKQLAPAVKPAADAASTCAAAFDAAESKRSGGDLAGAIESYRTVVTRCPDFCAAYNNMGLTLHKLGRAGESLPLFEQALRCNPKENLFKDNYDLTVKRLRTAQRPE